MAFRLPDEDLAQVLGMQRGNKAAQGAPTASTPSATPRAMTQAAIPNAGIYLEQQALAQQAYEAALTQLNAKQTSLYNRFGLRMNNDQLEVDPHNQFGEYQQMRRNQAMELEDVEDRTLSRGLRGGLAGQLLNPSRYAHGLQNLGLSNSFLDAYKGIESDKQSALFAKNRAMWEAERDQAMRSIDEEDFTPPPVEESAADPTSNTAPQRKKLARAYNPQAYVRGGASAAVARATQNAGYGIKPRPKPYDASYYRRMVR